MYQQKVFKTLYQYLEFQKWIIRATINVDKNPNFKYGSECKNFIAPSMYLKTLS